MLGLLISDTGKGNVIENVVIANAVQPLLTIVYFTYNGLSTPMSLAREWGSYALVRKGLCLSTPSQGQQRSTYFLSLPYRLTLPLMLLAGVVHWLASQSIFIAVIEQYDIVPSTSAWLGDLNGYFSDCTGMSCGYSPLALLSMGITWLLMIIGLLGAATRSLKLPMPLAGGCTAATAAACHVSLREDGFQTAVSKVQWGITDEPQGVHRPGHCTFSREQVRTPLTGEIYL